MDFTEPCAAPEAPTTTIMHHDSYTTFSEAGVGECDPALAAQRRARDQFKLLGSCSFLPAGGVSVYVAPSTGKGLGLYSSEYQRAGTVIACVNCSIVTDGEARAHFDYIEARKRLLLLCEPPTIEKPGSLANTQTTKRLNNSRFVISVAKSKDGTLIPRVRILLTRGVAAGTEVFVDYGKRYRSQLRQLNRASNPSKSKKRARDDAGMC